MLLMRILVIVLELALLEEFEGLRYQFLRLAGVVFEKFVSVHRFLTEKLKLNAEYLKLELLHLFRKINGNSIF